MPDLGTGAAQLEIRERVREFYDSVGWTVVGDGLYQNAQHEDLRPVSREYIHRCHLRVGRHLPARGRLLLDAGSGPIQYPEYLDYSRGFARRVCLDLSRVALREARERIGAHGFFVVGDIARLPFAADAFDALVSLHTVHHLPAAEQGMAFGEFSRVLAGGGRAVVVYSWGAHSALMTLMAQPMSLADGARRIIRRAPRAAEPPRAPGSAASGTFSHKHDPGWMRANLDGLPGLEFRVWRSASTQFLRSLIHGPLLGRYWLRLLFTLEEIAPKFFGRVGQYAMIVFHKPEAAGASGREVG